VTSISSASFEMNLVSFGVVCVNLRFTKLSIFFKSAIFSPRLTVPYSLS